MQAVKAAVSQATSRPSRAAAVASRTLVAAALSEPPSDRDRTSRSPSSSLSPPPPSPSPSPPLEDYKNLDAPSPGAVKAELEEDEKPVVKEKKKRAPAKRKPKEPVVYVIPDVEKRETTWNGRLGYACLNTILRKAKPDPIFCSRTCRIDTIKREDKGMPYLKELGRQNMADLTKLIEWNVAHHIYFMRMSSEMFPFAPHPDYQYSLDYAEKELKEAGDTAKRLGVRLTTHPGQFTQLGSPRRQVVENAYRDLEYHNEMMERMGLDKDSVIIIHGGGVYGDKESAMARFKENYKELSQGVKNRLVLENDEICYNVDDLLPICEELNIPLVFDYHHDWIYPSSQSPAELMPRILATWKRKGIKPKFHLSEPRKGAETIMEKRAHADRCQKLPDPLPEECDLMIEAKDKEQAVFHLFRIYDLHPTIHDDLRPPAEEETKQTARTAGKAAAKERKKVKLEAAEAAALSAGSASADDTASTDGTATGTDGETDGTHPASSPRAVNEELEGLSPKKAKKVFVDGGIAALPEGLDAEGQAYNLDVKPKKKATPKKRAPAVKKVKVKAEEGAEAEEKPAKAKTPRKRKSAAVTSAEEGGEEGEDVKPVVKKARKTPVKKAKAAPSTSLTAPTMATTTTATTTDESATEADHEATPHKRHEHHYHHSHHSHDEAAKVEDVKPVLEVGGLEEVAMEVAKE